METRQTKIFFVSFLLLMACIIGLSLYFNIKGEYANSKLYAKIEADASFNNDLLFRRWAAWHGGVYVPVTDSMQPNPYLDFIPNRDVTTTSGVQLTLMNPSYIVRQVFEIGRNQYGVKGHITSLNPIRPENKPDDWEKAALEKFMHGATEYHSIETIDRTEHTRFMHVLFVEQRCLGCHQAQGYKVGDVIGGISVSVPMDKYNQIANLQVKNLITIHALIYIIILILSSFVYVRYKANLIKRNLIKTKNEESEYKYKTAFKTSPDAVTIHKMSGIYVDINSGFTHLTGYSHKEVIGYTSTELNLWCDFADRDKLVNDLNTKGNVSNKEMVFRRKDGSTMTCLTSSSLLQINGEPHVLSITRDITDRKMLENDLLKAKDKAEESDRLKTAFLQNISHEVRTPLNAIQGFAELMSKMSDRPDKLEQFSKLIAESTSRLIDIITDVVEMSHIQAKLVNVSMEKINLLELFHAIRSDFSAKVDTNRVEFRVNVNLAPHISIIFSDRSKLVSIMAHLIDNAIKFTHDGQIDVTVTTEHDAWLVVKIIDTGIGISPEMLKLVVEPFRQAETGSSRKYGGNGLGLSIANAFTQHLNGTIAIESQLEKGSCVTVKLPLNLHLHRTETATLSPLSKKVRNVLIAEDEYANFLYLSELLERFDLNIHHAENGHKAVEICQTQQIDLVLMDIKMPIMSGDEAAKIIRSQHPHIIIVAQTAYAIDYERKRYSDLFDDYVTKPIRVDFFDRFAQRFFTN